MTSIGLALDPAAEERRIIRREHRRRFRPWGEGLIGVLAFSMLGTGLWFQGANQSTPIDAAALFAQEFGDTTVLTAPDASGAPGATAGTTLGDNDETSDEAAGDSAAPAVGDESETARTEPGAAAPSMSATDQTDSNQDTPQPDGAVASAEPPAAPAAPTFALPAEGIYTYATTGYESLSLAGARHDYPDESYIVLRHTGGCEYTQDHRILEEKEGKNTICNTGSEMRRVRYDGAVTFFGQTEESHYTCQGVIMDLRDVVGTAHRASCVSDDGDGETQETVTLVAVESMTIGGETVEAWHYHQKSDITGAVHGGGEADFWFRPSDGLMLRTERSNQSFANAFGGDVEYNEEATFQLTSLTPQR